MGSTSTPFELFGAQHCLTMLVIVAMSVGLAYFVRRASNQQNKLVRYALAAFLVCMTIAVDFDLYSSGNLWEMLPLHLCDMALAVAIFALVTQHQRAVEILYFWTCSGTFLATITPTVDVAFPGWRFISFFSLHGGVIVAAVVLVFGCRIRPQPGAAMRAFMITNAYAAFVGVFDFLFDQNYMFLCEKPSLPTMMDHMGPWPLYILVCEIIALALFTALYLPFRPTKQELLATS